MGYSEVWDLEVFFEGGSHSPQLREHLDLTQEKIKQAKTEIEQLNVPTSIKDAEKIARLLEIVTDLSRYLRQVSAVVGCYVAQDTKDEEALLLEGKIQTYYAQYQTLMLMFQQTLAKTDEAIWESLMTTEQLTTFQFILNEWRDDAALKLSEKEEKLITALSVDGYHSWGQLYDQLIAQTNVEVDLGGQEGHKKVLSVGQAENLSTHQSPAVRREAYEQLEAAWTKQEDFFATALNHLAGFRLAVYEKRGWDSVLQEPLNDNRMSEETLQSMWHAIEKYKAPFVRFLNRKADILGKEKIEWYDLDAPITSATETISYQAGAEFILKHFKEFSPRLEEFSRQAFNNRWIEAEDRADKRPGGFCTEMPLSGESRIFMTYSGSMSNVATLAHELGHAFHSDVLRSIPYLNRGYAMGVAETASTFAEMIVADAAVQAATTKEEKIALLEDKIQSSIAFFMNIHARFLFETRFYEERKKGFVPARKLNDIMESAQREAYGDALNTAHPHFWASKLHFYITDVPFYNFPYTFGYLFSLSIYAKAREEGKHFEEKYIALLQDTAVMSVEELAQKHLNEDITQQSFWEKGIALCVADVEEFLTLTDEEGWAK